MSDIVVTVESNPVTIELQITEPQPISVNFSNVAIPDGSIIANRVAAEEAADAAADSLAAIGTSVDDAEAAQAAAAASATAAEAAQAAAEAAKVAAELAETNASASQTAAAASEAAALESANLALESEVNAGISEVNAAASEAAAELALTHLSNGYCYLGDPVTDGTWRLFNDAGTLKMEKRVAGSWTTLNEYTI